jgi:phage gp36-like protein
MAFLVKADFNTAIQENILDEIVEFDDTLIDVVIRSTVAFIQGYLNSRYDTAAIFAETGADRNPIILMYAIDIALHDLHARINPRKIPDHRKERYKAAKEWLMDVSEAVINPPDLPVPAEGEKDYIRFGSNTKRDNHI